MNRRFNTLITDLHFAPTKLASTNLIKEEFENRIIVTGNTVIDALLFTKNIDQDVELSKLLEKKFTFCQKQKTLLITGHRRENLIQVFKTCALH